MAEFLTEEGIDYDEVLRRGGHNSGDEDFAFFKCPFCRQVYLLEYEAPTVYLDPLDLDKRAPVSSQNFCCVACRQVLPGEPWIGPKASPKYKVAWEDVAATG